MKHKERIIKILKEKPEARQDDKLLTYLVFQEIAKENGQGIFIPFNLFKKFPAFETVKRTRAKIQNEEKQFLPDNQKEIKEVKRGPPKEIIEVPDCRLRNSYLR